MENKRPIEAFSESKKQEYFRHTLVECFSLPPQLLEHDGDFGQVFDKINSVDKERLINILNHINFMDKVIFIQLRHFKYEESILLTAKPESCLGGKLICHWSNENQGDIRLQDYKFLNLVIDDGRSMLMVPGTISKLTNEHLAVLLPETSYEVGRRRAKRFEGKGVSAELGQSGFVAKGELLNFSPSGFNIRVSADSSCSFQWFNPDQTAVLSLKDEQRIFFSGSCLYVRQGENDFQGRQIVLAPKQEWISRYRKKLVRNPRQHLLPSPTISFEHPFLKKRVQFEISDISTSGFSIYESEADGVLVPGMIIPELTINFAGALKIECSAQVIYRINEEEKGVRCGLAILDMDIKTYSLLSHVLSSALDPHFYLSNDVDMDALWEFFFDSGFIYPTKYRNIQARKEEFKATYNKLYQSDSDIARHFTYRKNGRIFGHISLVRAYEKSWIIQHHSARALKSRRTGFLVLKQIMHHLNDMYRLPSANMDHVMTYFRPENKFPDRVFGGFARQLKDPKACSLDLFSYLPYTSLALPTKLPEGWLLRECSAFDLWELNRFYNHSSGGVFLDALGLSDHIKGSESLEMTYKNSGFLRKMKAYSLVHNDRMNAVLIVNQSEIGFNLSELLNGIKVLVTNLDETPWNILSAALAQLTGTYSKERVPILFFPFDYVMSQNIPYEKQYQLWILNVQYANDYMEYMYKKFRIRYD